MIENIVVDVSPLTNTLRIGRLGKARTHLLEWEDREDEILCAVRDFLYNLAEQNNSNTFGYEWTRKDGKVVELRVTQKAERDARDVLKNYLKPFEMVKDYFYPNNMTEKEFDEFLQDVGDTPRTPKERGADNA